MDIKTCIPPKLPLNRLNWETLVEPLGEAHRVLGQFDEILRQAKDPRRILAPLLGQEARACLHSQKERLREQIADYQSMLGESIATSRTKPLSLALLRQMHKGLKKGGQFRKKQNWIGPEGCGIEEAYFYPPSPKRVARAMRELHHYLRTAERDPLVQLAIYVAQLLIIHPFMDGNGRVARAMVPLILFKKGLIAQPFFFLSAFFKRRRLEYFRKLFQISAHGEWEEWIRFFLAGITEQGRRNCKEARKWV